MASESDDIYNRLMQYCRTLNLEEAAIDHIGRELTWYGDACFSEGAVSTLPR